jgi:hypothetical protein
VFVAARQLTLREREILDFLIDAPGLPDRERLLRQAEVATVDEDRYCPCGCASIMLVVNPSRAPQARPLPHPCVFALANDLKLVAERHGLTLYGDDGTHVYEGSDPVPSELDGACLSLTLSCSDGWLSSVEISAIGDFGTPEVFPPPDVFEPPEINDLLRT